MSILKDFRLLADSVEMLSVVLRQLVHTRQEMGPALERLETLELSRHEFEAECHALTLKADSTLKAAANAESRERHLKKQNEKLVDEFYPTGEERSQHAAVLRDDAAASQEEEVQPLRLDVATNHKAQALRAKWGVR